MIKEKICNYIIKLFAIINWHWKKTRHLLIWDTFFDYENTMATYSLDTEYHTIVTIDGQDYAVGIIQEQDELIQRIQWIDEYHDLQEQWIAILSWVLSKFNDKVELTQVRESELYKVILLLIQQLPWE